MDKTAFIKNQLARVEGAIIGDKQATIRCPFHDDTNPSLNISLIYVPGKVAAGGFSCWSCHESGGWNKLAERLNLEKWEKQKLEDDPDNPFYALQQEINSLASADPIQYEKPATEGLWQGSWRGLSELFLRQHGAEMYWDRIAEEYRVFFPVIDVQNQLVGHVLARGENSEIPAKYKYLNSKGFPAQKVWYCLNYEKNPKTLVIVEGPFDCLRFRSVGIPAIAVLGIGQLTEVKVSQIISKGCNRVVLALDADDAGRGATPEYAAKFSEFGIDVVDLNLSQYLKNPDEKMDPGNCPDEVINDLKNFLKIPHGV